ncbi:MAG: putative peptidoglycan lipid flippase, partial [Verrucomicrobiota bacterium]
RVPPKKLPLRGANTQQSARMSQLHKSSGAMSAATMLSRVLGLVREMVYAGFMGDRWVAGAFTLAFMVPNLFRRLLGEGALTAAFIPIFKEKEASVGEPEMWRAANAVLSGLVAGASAITLLAVLGITLLLSLHLKPSDTFWMARLLWNALPWACAAGAAGFLLLVRRVHQPLSPPLRAAIGVSAGVVTLFLSLLVTLGFAVELDLKDAETVLMFELLRVMFPYVILVCVAAVFMGMLNARGHFFVPAMGATMLNVVMIASVLFLAPLMGSTLSEKIFGLAIGVVVAGIAQAGFQVPLLRREGFRFEWISPWKNDTVRRVVRQMVPGAIGVAAFQLNVLITQGFAFSVDGSVVASFSYAVRLMELPQGVFGISLATYLLPTLSGLAAEKKYPEFRSTLRQGIGWLTFVNLLAGVLLLTLAEPMVRLLFQHGAFDEFSTGRASRALMCLAPGLVAFSLVNILARAFYALGDTKTPMGISIFCLAVNVVFSLALLGPLRQAGLALANTMSAVVNASLLLYALRRKLKTLELSDLRSSLPALAGATLVAGGVAWSTAAWWGAHIGHGNVGARLGEVFVPMTLASIAYLGLAAWLKTGHTAELLAMVRARLGLK